MRFGLTRLLVGFALLMQAITLAAAERPLIESVGSLSCSRAETIAPAFEANGRTSSDGSQSHAHDRCLQCDGVAFAPPPFGFSRASPARDALLTKKQIRDRAAPLGRRLADPNVFARAGPALS